MIENAIATIPEVPTEGTATGALAAVRLNTIESDAVHTVLMHFNEITECSINSLRIGSQRKEQADKKS